MLRSVASKLAGVTLVVALLILAGGVAEYAVRCAGEPLDRETALERANGKLQRFSKKFAVGDQLPRLVEERFDAEQQLWLFMFRNSACEIVITASRCDGTDIGGTNGCRVLK